MSAIETQKEQPYLQHIGVTVYRWLASVKLAVVLLVALAIVLAESTFIEAARGRDYA